MLKVASFEITDAVGINAVLTTHRLAAGASVFVSEGKVCIPIEDGEPENTVQKIIGIKELKNAKLKERELMEHSLKVNEVQLADRKAELENIENIYITQPNDKVVEARYKAAQAKVVELENLKLQNDHEIRLININIEKFDEAIAALQA